MSAVVDARIPTRDFALGRSLEEQPGATFEIFKIGANATDDIVPFLWGSGADPDSILASLRSDPTTHGVELVDEFDGECLFRMEWMANLRLLFDVFLDEDESALFDARCTDDEWQFRLLVPDDGCIQSMCQECEELGLKVEIERMYQLSDSFRRDQYQLTQKQYETVLAAYEAGYYDVPRKVTLKNLARRLDISHQALSERLRRGHEALIANGLETDPERTVVVDAGDDDRMNRPPIAQFGTR